MENVIFCILYLGLVILTETLSYIEVTKVNSAIPVFIFQLLVLLDEKVKRENNGTGVLRMIINWIRQ